MFIPTNEQKFGHRYYFETARFCKEGKTAKIISLRDYLHHR